MTIKELKANSIKQLLSKNVDVNSANLDVSILLSFSLNIKREFLLSHDDKVLSQQEIEHYNSLIQRRFNDEPIAYIIGSKEFYGLNFKVDNNVLIPRPETEELVEYVINSIDNKNSRIIDIGAGSGCIAITLKHLVDTYDITALDISKNALNIAKENAYSILPNNNSIDFVNENALKYIPSKKFDVIVSNPPYISNKEKDSLSNDVKNYEPSLALFSGDSGYEFYEKIYGRLDILLNSRGKFFFEIGHQQEKHLRKIFRNKNISFIKDISGKSRFMIGSI